MSVANRLKPNQPRKSLRTFPVSSNGSKGANGSTDEVCPTSYCRWKSLLGRMLALILLVPMLPVIGLLVLLVRLTSRGPGIYRQTRVGKDGRSFTMYKIRTMRLDAETNGAVWADLHDDRNTSLGNMLRKLHLDEFPQLFNVLKGEMVLVGPRPERPEFVHVLAEEIPEYLQRLSVHPGITGLAQINLPPDTDLESVRRKLVLDLEYIETAGFWLDVRILAYTFMRISRVSARIAVRTTKTARQVAPAKQTQRPIVQADLPRLAVISPHGNGANGRNGHRTVGKEPTHLKLQSDQPVADTPS